MVPSAQIQQWIQTYLGRPPRPYETEVWLADPGRAYLPRDGLVEMARYSVPTTRELEDRDRRRAGCV